jgi:hypothetical protein
MFKFDPANEYSMLAKLDDLRKVLGLPSRGHVVEIAVRHLAVLVLARKNKSSVEMGIDRQEEGVNAIPE